MGWLNEEERRAVKKKFKVRALYICNNCQLPILGPPVVDPKGGYHPWSKSIPKVCRNFMGRNPKITYCLKCSESRLYFQIDNAIDSILEKIRKKPKSGYWTKEKIQSKLKLEKKVLGKALKALKRDKLVKKKRGGYVPIRRVTR